MSDAQEISIDCGYLKLAARRWGDEQAPAVLALHGWLDNAASFDHLAPLLRGVQLIALDLPGHGRSGHRAAGSHYHFVDFMADVVNAADALDLPRFALLGHSMGAAIASLVAGVVPDRITRLALIEGLGPFSGESDNAPQQLLRAITEMNAVGAKRPPVYASADAAAEARRQAGDFGAPAALTLTARGIRRAAHGFVWRADPQLRVKSPIYMTESQVAAFLGRVSAPSLLISAERGLLPEHPEIEARALLIPQLELHTLEGGHHLHLDAPESVAGTLNPFFARLC